MTILNSTNALSYHHMLPVVRPYLNHKHMVALCEGAPRYCPHNPMLPERHSMHVVWAELVTKPRVQRRVKFAGHHWIVWTSFIQAHFFFSHTRVSKFFSIIHSMFPHTHTQNQPRVDGVNPENSNWSVVAATEQRVMEWGMELKATHHAGPCCDNSQQNLWPVPVTVLNGFRDKHMHTLTFRDERHFFGLFSVPITVISGFRDMNISWWWGWKAFGLTLQPLLTEFSARIIHFAFVSLSHFRKQTNILYTSPSLSLSFGLGTHTNICKVLYQQTHTHTHTHLMTVRMLLFNPLIKQGHLGNTWGWMEDCCL